MIEAMKKDLVERFKDFYNEMQLYVAYTNCLEKAELFKQEIEKAIPNVEVTMMDSLSLSVACHIGSGSIAIACARKYIKSSREK